MATNSIDPKQIGAYHLAARDNVRLYEPQRDNNFEFLVTGLGDLIRVGGDENSKITNAQDVLRFSVESFSVPTFTQNVITIERGNSVMKAAGKPQFNDGTLVINDYIGADGKSVLMAWQNLSYNVYTEKIGAMADYKKTCWLSEYTPDYKLVRTWRLEGCWVSGLQQGDFTMTSDGKKTISATITYDKAFMELPDEEQ